MRLPASAHARTQATVLLAYALVGFIATLLLLWTVAR